MLVELSLTMLAHMVRCSWQYGTLAGSGCALHSTIYIGKCLALLCSCSIPSLQCRVVLKDAVKTHSIEATVDTAYEDFVAELKSKAEEQIQDIAEPMRYMCCRS